MIPRPSPSMAQKLPLLFLPLLFLALPAAFSASMGFRARLIRADTSGDLNKAVVRSNRRLVAMASKLAKAATTDVQASVHDGADEFLMILAIGTPALVFSAIVDTGSDLIWTQCTPCDKCFAQPTPLFDPAKSSTFSKLPCSGALCKALPSSLCSNSECRYSYAYQDNSTTQGVLASETFTFDGKVSAPGISFGCGSLDQGDFSNSSGLVGLGRGPLSLISQLGSGKFSYCLDSDVTKTSPLLFGSLAKSPQGKASTPLIVNPAMPSLYYLNLEGISVGGALLPIPRTAFAIQANGSGGVAIDSGTTFTTLEAGAYKLVKQAFLSQVSLPVANGSRYNLDLCFSMKSVSYVKVPLLRLHFDGADMDLPEGNYMVQSKDLLCLAILPSSTGLSILGNILQLDMLVLYDLEAGVLSFAPAKCDSL